MKILLLTTAYPSEGNYYNHGFIHSRVLEYKKLNNNLVIDICVIDHGKQLVKYVYEGITVYKGHQEVIKNSVDIKSYDRVIVHFLDHKIIDYIESVNYKDSLIVWVHGAEALSWKRRTFNKFNLQFLKYILSNKKQLKKLHQFTEANKHRIKFIFVSNWMKEIMEEDCNLNIKNYEIIPNVINTEFFKYKEKNIEDRKRILMIRPFTTRKYATDIAIKTIEKLEKEFKEFKDLSFTIIGDGPLYENDVSNIKNLPNVQLINKFLHHKEIKEYHDKNGVMLIPTRQDSQGVSMCEAMSSGLVPVTSNNTAIPEFINEDCGYLCNSVDDLANAIIELYNNPEIFINKSQNSSSMMNKKCSEQYTIIKEYDVLMEGI